jgi:hypothetical protein
MQVAEVVQSWIGIVDGPMVLEVQAVEAQDMQVLVQ